MSRYNQNHNIVLILPESPSEIAAATSHAPSGQLEADAKEENPANSLDTIVQTQQPCCNIIFQGNLTNYNYQNYYVNQYTGTPSAQNIFVNNTSVPVLQQNADNNYITGGNIQDPNTTCLYPQQYYNGWISDTNLNAYSTFVYHSQTSNLTTAPNDFNSATSQVIQYPCCNLVQNSISVDNSTCAYIQQYPDRKMSDDTPVTANMIDTNDLKNNNASLTNEQHAKHRIKLNLINPEKSKTGDKNDAPSQCNQKKSNLTEKDTSEKIKSKGNLIKKHEAKIDLSKKENISSANLCVKDRHYKSLNTTKSKSLENDKTRSTSVVKPMRRSGDKYNAVKSINKNMINSCKDKNNSTVKKYDRQDRKGSAIISEKICKSTVNKTDNKKYKLTETESTCTITSERTRSHEKSAIIKRKKPASPEIEKNAKREFKSVRKDTRLSESRANRILILKKQIEKMEKIKKTIRRLKDRKKQNNRSKTKSSESDRDTSQEQGSDYDTSLNEYMKLKRENIRETNCTKRMEYIPQSNELQRLRADENIDLRTTLSRKRSRNESHCMSNLHEEKLPDRENLFVTIQQDVNTGTVPSPTVPTNIKHKRRKKIKLVINVFCEESTSSESDENTETCTQQRNELSFLDDFDIDEIVDSLNNGTGNDEIIKNTSSDNPFKSSSTEEGINKIIATEVSIKSEPDEKIVDSKYENNPERVSVQEDMLHIKLEKLFGSDCENHLTYATIDNKNCSDSTEKDETLFKKELIDSNLTNSISRSHDINNRIEMSIENSDKNEHVDLNSFKIKSNVDSSCNKIEQLECAVITPAGHVDGIGNANDFVVTQELNEPIIISDDESDGIYAENKQTHTEMISIENHNVKNVNNEIDEMLSVVPCPIENGTELIEQNGTLSQCDETIEKNTEESKDTHSHIRLNEQVINKSNEVCEENNNITNKAAIIIDNYHAKPIITSVGKTERVQKENDIKNIVRGASVAGDLKVTNYDKNTDETAALHKTEVKHDKQGGKYATKPDKLMKSVISNESCRELFTEKITNDKTSSNKTNKGSPEKRLAANAKILPVSNDNKVTKKPPINGKELREVNKREARTIEEKKEVKSEIRNPKSNTDKKIVETAQTHTNVSDGNSKHTFLKNLSISELNFVYKLESRISQCFKDRYRITSLIRDGRFSETYKCMNSQRETYAVKVLKKVTDSLSRGLFKAKMFSMLQAYTSNQNSSLIFMMHSFNEKRHWCFLFDYYPKNLEQALVENSKCFHINLVQILARQLVDAVSMLANNSIVHTDIKPKHILLNSTNDKLKLAGFDESSYIQHLRLTPSSGTPNYRAPEVILGFTSDCGVDVWSTALVIYEMATGTKLFPGTFNYDILYKQMCTLGKISEDMILNSSRRCWYFSGTTFTRKFGEKGEKVQYINYFQRSNRIVKSLFGAYKVHWQPYATKQEVYVDKTKIKSLENLLEKMLVLDPRYRLPITFVGVSEFLHSLFYTDM